MSDIRTLPGFREFYPEDRAVLGHIFDVWRQACRRYGFREWESPVLEPLELFTEKSGEEIVRQLFNFEDKGGRQVSLRPEMTPSLARMVGARANGMAKPIRWFAIGENYRYEKPQKGRLRAFYQLNADLLGEAGPAADAELIALCADCLLGFGLTQLDFRIRISDRTLWFRYLASVGVPEANATAVLGVVDKLERGSPKDLIEAMTAALAGTACDPEKTLAAARAFAATRSLEELAKLAAGDAALTARLDDWRHLLGTLKSMGFGECIAIDLTIVRGLAYYTGFVFEAFETGGEARALAGGGRYDALVKKLGGPDLPAVGFGMGDVTLRDLLEAKKLIPAYADGPDFFVMVLGADARAAALEDVANLRRAGFRVEYNLRDGKFGKLAQQAETAGAKYALVYGGEEVAKGVTKVRSLTDRTEAELPRTDLVPALRAVLEEGMRAILP
jgi:histidyl-tRNA synthetase